MSSPDSHGVSHSVGDPVKWVLAAAAIGWGAALAYSSASARALYGDGAWYVLIHLLSPNHFNDYDFQRSFASVISQAPVLFGQRLGVDSVAGFAALYSLGIFVIPAGAMIAALVLARRQPLLFAANGLAILVYGFGANFINTEANLLFGLVWLSVSILALDREALLLRGILLPFLAIALVRSYEGMLLVGPVLALWAIRSALLTKASKECAGLILAALLYLLGAVIGLGGFLAPRDLRNASSFLDSAFAYLSHPHVFILLSGLVVLPAICLDDRRVRTAAVLASALLGAGFVVGILRLDGFYAFTVYYYNRSFMVLLLPFLVAALFAVHWLRPEWLRVQGNGAGHVLFLIPLAFAVVGDAVGTQRWNDYVRHFCEVLDKDATPLERVRELSRSGSRTAWTWTHPAMSVLLRDRGSKAMVVNEPGAFGWEPFDPARASSIAYRGLCQAPLLGPAKPESFAVPMSFATGTYPPYVDAITGLAQPEGWATWSLGPKVEIRFTGPLPPSFKLAVRLGSAFGSNRRLPITARVGGQAQSFIVDHEPTDIILQFRDVGDAAALSFEIPKPESPAELGLGGDTRRLGVAFVSLQVTPQ